MTTPTTEELIVELDLALDVLRGTCEALRATEDITAKQADIYTEATNIIAVTDHWKAKAQKALALPPVLAPPEGVE